MRRPVESEILRAVRRGEIGWSDLSSRSRDYSIPVKTVGRPYVEEAKDGYREQVKTPVVDQTTAKTGADSTIGETVSKPKATQTQQPQQPKRPVDVTGTPTPTAAMPNISKPDTGKYYGLFDFASDSFKDFRLGLIKSQGDDALGRNSFNVTPNMLAADAINDGISKKDPDVIRVAQFIEKKQNEAFYEKPETRFSDKQVMSASELTEYNRLKNEDSEAMSMNGLGAGFGIDGSNTSASRYKKSLEAKYAAQGKTLVTPMEMDELTRDQLMINSMVESASGKRAIGNAMKAPLRYMANPTKLVGDVANLITNKQTLFDSTKGDLDRDMANLYEDAETAYMDRKYKGKQITAGTGLKRVWTNFRDEAAGSAAQATAIGAMFAGGGATLPAGAVGAARTGLQRAITAKLPQFESSINAIGVGATYLGAGHAAYRASDAVRKPGWRDINEAEIPDDMQDAFAKYGKALIHASRSEYREMPNPSDIANGRLPDGDRWYHEIKYKLNKEYEKNSKEYEESQAKLNDAPKTSQYFDDQKASGRMLYNWQESFGASSKEWVAQTAGMMSSIVLNKAAGVMASKGIWKGNAPYLTAGAMSGFVNAGAAFISREGEFYSQFADTWNNKLMNKLKESGKENYFENLNNPELERQIKAGIVRSGDPDVDQALYYANEQADELARQQMSLIYTDMGSIVASTLPFNTKSIAAATKGSNTLFGNIAKAADEATDWATRNTLGKINTQKSIGKIAYFAGKMSAKGAASTLLEATTETFGEEVPQYITSDLYTNNELNSKRSHLASLVDVYGAAITGTKAAMGISGDERYDSNPELLKTVKHSMVLSAIMGSTHGIPANIATGSDIANEITARNFIKATVIPNMRVVAREGKTAEYMNLKSKGKQDAVLQYMEELKQNLPEGVTAEDIDNEMTLAKRTFEIMDNKIVREYAKNAGGVNSENHKLLTSIIVDHEDMEAEALRYHEEMYDSALESVNRNISSSNLGKQLVASLKKKNIEGVDVDVVAKRIYTLMAQLQGLEYLDWTINKNGSTLSKKRDETIQKSAKEQAALYRNALVHELETMKLISKNSASHLNKLTRISDVVEYLEDNYMLTGADQESIDRLGLSAAAYAGSEYERISAEMLSGYKTEYEKDDEGQLMAVRKRIENYDVHVDSHLDAYRSARKAEEDLEKNLTIANRARNRAMRKYTGRGVVPFQTYINDVTPAEEKQKNDQEIMDASIAEMQARTGRSGIVEVEFSEETEATLDKIDNDEFQPNTFLEAAMDELDAERKRLLVSKESNSRLHTRAQIDDMIDFIEDYMEEIGNRIAKNEKDAFGREWTGIRKLNKGARFESRRETSPSEIETASETGPTEDATGHVEPLSPKKYRTRSLKSAFVWSPRLIAKEVNQMTDEELNKVSNKIDLDPIDLDARIELAQDRLGVFDTSILELSDETESTLSDILRGVPVINSRLISASSELYAKYKLIGDSMRSDNRKNTVAQLKEMQDAIGDEIERIERMIDEQTTTGEFSNYADQIDSIDGIDRKRTIRRVKRRFIINRLSKMPQEAISELIQPLSPTEGPVALGEDESGLESKEMASTRAMYVQPVISSIIVDNNAESVIANNEMHEPSPDFAEKSFVDESGDSTFTEEEPEFDNKADSQEALDSAGKEADESTGGVTPVENEAPSEEVDSRLESEDSSLYYELDTIYPNMISPENPDVRYDKLSHTLIWQTFAGNDERVKAWLVKPDALNNARITFKLKEIPEEDWAKRRKGPDKKYVKFDRNNPSTYDAAIIDIEIKSESGVIYKFMLSIPNAAEYSIKRIGGAEVNIYSPAEIALLRQFRNSVIETIKEKDRQQAELNKAGEPKVLGLNVVLQRGKAKISLNRNKETGAAIQRPVGNILGMIDGFDPQNPDWSKVGVGTLKLAYGRGGRGRNIMVGPDRTYGFTVEQASGAIFVIKQNPVTGFEERIKINKLRMKDDKSIARLVYSLAVRMKASPHAYVTFDKSGKLRPLEPGEIQSFSISANKLLTTIVNFGGQTYIAPEERETLQHLVPKQFYITKDGSKIVYGENYLDITSPNDIPNEKANELIKYIEDNFHWNIDKNKLWNQSGGDAIVGNLFPEMSGYFENNDGELKFTDSMVFTREDMGLTWTAWLAKNGKLVSDVNDGLFDPTFLYMSEPTIIDSKTKEAHIPTTTQPEVMPIEHEDAAAGVDVDDNTTMFDDMDAALGIDPSAFRIAQPSEAMTNDDLEAEAAWLQNKLGITRDPQPEEGIGAVSTLEILDEAINAGDGQIAMGATKWNSILLWRGAEKGTLYHEAFHHVSLIAMPRSRRMKVYNAVRLAENGRFKDYTDKQIEEFLAEGFREYMLSGTLPLQQEESKGLKAKIRNLFKRIKSVVLSFVGMSDGDVTRLYKDIKNGRFYVKPGSLKADFIDDQNRKEFAFKYGSEEKGGAAFRVADLGMKHITDYKLLNNLVDGLAFMVKHYGNVNTISDVENINKGIETVLARIKKDMPKLDEAKKVIYQDVIDNFDTIFLPRINKVFSGMNVDFIDESETAKQGENTISEEIMYHAKGSHEFSKRDNLTAEVKFFLRTIPNTIMKDGRPTFVRNEVTGMYGFVPFEQAWNKCVADLSDSRTVEAMLNKINQLAKIETSGFYTVLASKIKASDEDTRTRLWISLRNHINQYVNIQYTSNIEENSKAFTIVDANLDNPSKKFPMQWGETLAAINTIYKTTDKGVEFDENAAKEILKSYDELVSLAYGHISGVNKIPEDSLYDIRNEYVNMFRKMGVTIDAMTIDYLTKEYYHDMDRVSALAKLIENSKAGMPSMLFSVLLPQIIKGKGTVKYKSGIVVQFKNIYKNEKYIQNIGMAYAYTHRSNTEQTVRSASGDTYHSVSERNYVINSFERLFADKQHRKYLLSSSYVKGASMDSSIPGSMFINQINNNTAYSPAIKTFLKIYNADKTGSDSGYKDVSALEDYVMKMAATLSGYATIPTMADKNIYYFVSGFKMPNLLSGATKASYSEFIDKNSGKTRVSFVLPNEYLRQLNNYFKAEFEAIKDAVEHYASTENDKEGRIEGYHYKGKNPYTGEVWAGNHGNGMRFRNFDMIHINLEENGQQVKKLWNLNDRIDQFVNEAISRGDSSINGMRDFISFMDRNYFGLDESVALQTMSNTFNVALSNELEWMSDNGIIKYVRNNDGSITLENNFIDNAMFNDQLKELGNTSGSVDVNNRHALMSIIGNHVLNTMISNTEFDKVVAGDPAFYGTQINKLKRHSMLLSTGSPLRTDFPAGHEFGPVDASQVNNLDDRQIRHKAGKFLSGEITDNIMYSKELDKIYSNIAAAQFIETTGIDMTMEELAPMFVQGKMSDGIKAVIGDNAMYKRAYQTATSIADLYANGGPKSKGYSEVDETDGGAFISAYMYRSILIREGKWRPEWDEAFDMMEGEDTSWMSDPVKYMKVAELAFGPLKMIYVGNQPTKGVNSVKTHKMALFAVTRPMATGDMKVIYDLMNNPKPGAGHFDFISVTQVNKTVSQNPKPFYTDSSNTAITPNLELDAYEDSFENLLHQLPTDPHGVDDINIATQVQKVSMSNVNRSKVYQNLSVGGKDGATGSELLNEWMNALVSMSNRGRKKFEQRLDIKINPVTGIYSINSKKLFNELANKAENSNMPEDVVDMFRSFDESNPDSVPLQAFMDGGWVENAFISLLTKETIDMKMPGGMYVQRSPFGIPSTYDNGVEIKVNNGERLRFINEDGSMDAIISINFFSDLFPKDLKKGSFVQKRQWLIDNNIIGKNSATSTMGYRIPTQGLSSISGLKFVDVIDDTQSDTIILPSEFTRLTGADFDIDKLFLSRYNFGHSYTYDENISKELESEYQKYINTEQTTRSGAKIARKEFFGDEFDDTRARVEFANRKKYFWDTNNSMWATAKSDGISIIRMNDDIEDKWERNSDRAIQNRLLETMLAVITEPSSMHETRMPLDNTTDAMKALLKEIETLVPKTSKVGPFNFIRPSFMTEKKIEYTVSKSGIGPYAQHNSNHPLTQIAGLSFIENGLLSMLGMQRLDLVKGRDGVRILDWLSALINAHVDVVKDPYIIRLGINKNTYKISSFLLRTGAGKSTFYYLSQPSLKEFYKIMDRFAGDYGTNSSESASADFQLANLINNYRSKAESLVDTEEQKDMLLAFDQVTKAGHKTLENCSDVFDVQFLRDALSTPKTIINSKGDEVDNFQYYYDQLKVLEMFQALQPFSNGLANLVKYSQIDTKKGGNTFAEQIEFAEEVNRMIQLERAGAGVFDGVERYYNATGLMRRLENSSILLQSLSSGMFFRTTPAVRASAKRMFAAARGRVGGEFKVLSKINKYIDSYIKHEFFKNFTEKNDIDIKGLFFGENTIAKRLFRIKQGMTADGQFSKFTGNEFLENLTYSIEPSGQTTTADHVYPMISATADQAAVNRTKQYLSDLINLDVVTEEDKVIKDFARDFIAYQFYSTGDNMSTNTVKIAEDDRYKIGYMDGDKRVTFYSFISDRLSQIIDIGTDQLLSESDIENIFLNRWHDNDLVRTVNMIYGYEYGEDPTGMSGGKQALKSPAVYSSDLDKPVTMFGNAYPLLFVDNSAKSYMYSDGHKVFSPFVKIKFNKLDDNGKSTGKVFYIAYKLIGVTNPEKKYKQKPIYSAVNKFGSKTSGYGLIEHGKTISDVYENNLPVANLHLNKSVTPENLKNRKDKVNAYNFGLIITDYIKVNPFNINLPDYSISTVDLEESANMAESIANIQIDEMIESTDYSMTEFKKSIESKYATYGKEWRENIYSLVAKGLIDRIDDLAGNINATDDIVEMIKSEAIEYLSEYVKEKPIEQAEELPFGGTSGGGTGAIALQDNFSRSSVESDPEYLYIFTDNANRTSGSSPIDSNSWYAKKFGNDRKFPSKTQAVIRGLDNAYPITTMVDQNRTQWTDDRFDLFKKIIDEEIEMIKEAMSSGRFKGIKYSGQMMFGKGQISNMAETAPAIFEYMNSKLLEIGINNAETKTAGQAAAGVNIASMSEITNHSGGAYGADTYWDQIGREFGVTSHMHYRDGENQNLSKSLRDSGVKATVLTKEQLDFARNEVERLTGEKYPDTVEGNLKARNYYQVANADAVFAIATIKDNSNVSGGTNVAVKLSIKMGKPLFVWDIKNRKWWAYDNLDGFVESDTPVLTKNFAGVGSRDIENYNTQDKKTGEWIPRKEYLGDDVANAAKQAIRDVYQKTLDSIATDEVQSTPVSSVSKTPIVEIKNFEEYGTLYQFIFEDGVLVSSQYKQNKMPWKDMKNAIKTYERLSNSKKANTTANAGVTIVESSEAADMTLLGVDISLSKIGIHFQPNEDQVDALEKISKWLEKPGFDTFALKGYAGTGKTAITKILVAALEASKMRYALMSPTHKAKRVLSKATGKLARTLHKFLGMKIGDQEVGRNAKFMEASELNMRKGMLLIIDESSMIDDTMVDDLMKLANDFGSKILFIGDDAQIDPVKNNNKPSKSLNQENSVTLDKVMRVSNGNPIIDVATAMRKAQDPALIAKFGNAFMSQFTRFNSFNDAGGVIFLGPGSNTTVIDYAISKWFTSDEAKGNPNYVRYIAYRNKVVDAVNVRVRDELGYSNVVEVGEIITGNIQYIDTDKSIQNEDEYKVVSIDSEPYMITSYAVPGVELPVIDVTIESYSGDSKGGRIRLLTDYSDDMIHRIQSAMEVRLSEIYAETDPVRRRSLNARMFAATNSDFDTIINIPNPSKSDSESDNDHYKRKTFGYSYAITAHKSQGSEFENVIINDSDIRRYDRGMDGLGYKKLLYTSITRAKHKAIVITDGGRYDMQNKTPIVGESMDAANFSEFTKESALDKIKELGNQSDNC